MKTTEENNRIIAIFIGWKIYDGLNSKWNYSFETNKLFPVNLCVEQHEMKFHNSWDWLIPVINQLNEKLKSTLFKTTLMSEISSHTLVNNINGVFTLVCEGVEWYNEQ